MAAPKTVVNAWCSHFLAALPLIPVLTFSFSEQCRPCSVGVLPLYVVGPLGLAQAPCIAGPCQPW